MKKYYCVISHTHWDREWYRSFEGFRMRLVDLVNNLLDIIEEYPEYIFHLDAQTIVIEDYLQIYPENREILIKHITNGNILVGPWYLQNDFYLTSGEATIRNLLKGTRLAKSFGKCANAGYAPDQFGNISQLPQILNNFGIYNFIFGRGYNPHAYNENGEKYLVPVDPEFIWKGADGSEVLAIHMRYWYNNAQRFSADIKKAELLVNAIENSFNDICATPYLLLMNGVDHLEAQDDLLPILENLNKCEINGEIKQTTLCDYIENFRKYVADNDISLSYHEGELRHGWEDVILQGTLSSRHYLKVENVKAQNMLENRIEPLYSMLGISGFKGLYPHNYLNYVWKLLLENHPHDSICGCSRDEVHKHMEDRFARVNEVTNELYVKALDNIAYHNGVAVSDKNAYSLVIANTVSKEFSGMVEAEIRFPQSEEVKNFIITDEKGNNIDFFATEKREEILDVFSSINLPGKIDVDVYKIYINTQNLAPMSFKGYKVTKSEGEIKINNTLVSCGKTFENEYLKVQVEENGSVNLLHKQSGRKIDDCLWIEDTADCGNAYIFCSADDTPISSKSFVPSVTMLENNEYKSICSIKWEMDLPKKYCKASEKRSDTTVKSEVELLLTLKKGIDYLNIDYKVNNKSSDHRLRLFIKSDIKSNSFIADIPYDVIRHIDGDENPMIKDNVHPNTSFAAIENGGLCSAVFTEGAHECAKMDTNTLSFTLVRSTGIINDGGEQWKCPDNQCIREISGRCGIYVGEYTDNAELLSRSIQFRNPAICHVMPCDSKKFTGGRPAVQDTQITELFYKKDKNESMVIPQSSVLNIDNSSLCVTTFKRTEDNKAWIIRLFNGSNEKQNATLNINGKIYRSNMNEEKFDLLGEGSANITLRSKEIATFYVEYL